ncbi:hypothetical protein [Ruegeria atlantica]|uniref:hypothetical protein n=1 Tax=Ruegeria atlantica TaxID=81569 RepID=UPI00071E2C90|nr:hypothetical protein [Ruegeria atlantica]
MIKSLTKFIGFPLTAVIAIAGVVQAKPLLTNSQETYVSACLDQSDTPERIIEICQHGQGGVGASDRQRIEIFDKLAWPIMISMIWIRPMTRLPKFWP